MVIEVVGKGCSSHIKLIKYLKELAKKSNKEINIKEVFDTAVINKFGITYMPALVVEGKVRFQGVNIDKDKIKEIFEI